jgi:hypothetical protein
VTLAVDVEPIPGTLLFHLTIRDGDQVIGEYERTRLNDIERKKAEVVSAADDLVKFFRNHGQFKVRWNSIERAKVVRNLSGNRIDKISRVHWRKPSWQKG